MLCELCEGAGSLFQRSKAGKFEWWTCPCCGGCGSRIQYGPPTIRIHAFREKWGKKNIASRVNVEEGGAL